MNTFEEELAALKAEYAQNLPKRIADLEASFEQAVAGAGWADVRVRAHKLRGSAGSYGFDDVSRLAGELEDAVKPVVAGTASAEPESLRRLLSALAGAVR